eukprot:COSAG01_NODE_74511_length_210_cov_238.963964_1_plen_66_part_10
MLKAGGRPLRVSFIGGAAAAESAAAAAAAVAAAAAAVDDGKAVSVSGQWSPGVGARLQEQQDEQQR